MRRINVYGRMTLCSSLSLRALTFESLDLQILFLVPATSSEYVGQGRVWGQGHGHTIVTNSILKRDLSSTESNQYDYDSMQSINRYFYFICSTWKLKCITTNRIRVI